MLVNANQSYQVTKEGKINALGAKIMPGGMIRTLTSPKKKDGSDRIFVRYSGGERSGEVSNGAKFWVKVSGLAAYTEPTTH